jgi:DNA-binding CsgD family transcriptional regulator
MKAEYLKIPVELAQNSFVEGFYKQAGTYLASQFYYSGKARLSDKPAQKIANRIGVSTRSVYRHFNWLLGRNWMGKDNINGWLFFRGLDRIREIEGWKRKRAAVMLPEDLQNFKEFLIGAVLSSIIKTGKGAGTDRPCKGSEPSGFPISLSLIQNVMGVSRRTAITYIKIAKKGGYIKKRPNLRQVTGISSKDIQLLKQNNVNRVKVNLFGSSESIQVKPQQLRTDKGYVYAQLANLITANVQLRKR